MDASELLPDGTFVAGDGERESFEPSIDWDASPDGGAQAGCGTGTAGATHSATENVTNEAKFDENAIMIERKYPVAVAAHSGVDPGLDKREEQPKRAEGNEEGPNHESQFSNLDRQLITDILVSGPGAAETPRPHLPRSP